MSQERVSGFPEKGAEKSGKLPGKFGELPGKFFGELPGKSGLP